MATTSDLARSVLQDLGIIAAEEAVPAADEALVIERYGHEFARLQSDGLAWWDEEDIPADAMAALSKILMHRLATAYGIARDDTARLAAELELRRLAVRTDRVPPIKAEYF